MATESNVRQPAHGVRTYRGRTLEEILPQIREELGADAIILREREGLVGGVGGFFAQRFVEVEARRGDGQSIDIYDEDDDADDLQALLGGAGAGEPIVAERPRILPPEPPEGDGRAEPRPFIPPTVKAARLAPGHTQAARAEAAHLAPEPFEPAPLEPAPSEPEPQPSARPQLPTSRRSFETDVFLERLQAASAELPDEDDDLAADVELALAEPVVAETELEAAEPESESETQPTPAPAPRRQRPERKPRTTAPRQARPQRPERRERPAKPAPHVRQRPQAAPVESPVAPQAEQASVAEPPVAPSPAPQAPPGATNPYESVRRRPPSLRVGLPTGAASVPAAGAPSPTLSPAAAIPPPPRPLELRGRGLGQGAIRALVSRLLGGRLFGSSTPRPSTPRPLDAVAAGEIASELAARGASHGWISQLIATAGAHGTPLADGLRAAARAEIARRIVPAPALPATGAAIAFIGAGGSGKTRCTAALASTYSRTSTLGVTVIALDDPGGAHELERLLSDDGVPVLSLSGERAQRAVAAARQSGLVIVDTPTATPTDAGAVETLAARLAPLGLDATFVALPATLGPQAARRALAGFGQLSPSAVAITHTDETDQLAVVVEIAITHRIPLAYLHAGTDHHSALAAVEAAALPEQLLAP